MGYDPTTFSADVRDVIGAWLVCLAVAAGFFGYPLVRTALDAPIVQGPAVAGKPSVAAPAEICAWHGASIGFRQG
ncbi:MAG TPA: hypothetical protein VJ770_05870 [Stellaceae bacterium]|nr:hypothetical protein [Stellaceae bacterium]